MTEAATTVTPAAPASPAAPVWPARGAPMPAAPVIPIEKMTVDQAREAIRGKIHDKDFGAKLLSGDAAARQEWTGLHQRGFPRPEQVTSTDDVNNQQAARNAEGWNQYVGWMRQQWKLTPEQEAEIRGGVIREQDYVWAKEEKARLIRDRGFYEKLMNGDRGAREAWGKVNAMLALRPVKPGG